MNQTLRTVLILVLGLAAGIGAAFLLRPPVPDPAAVPPVPTGLAAAAADRYENRIRILERERAVAEMRAAALATNHAALQEQVAELQAQLRRQPEPPVAATAVTHADLRSRAEARSALLRGRGVLNAAGEVSANFAKEAGLSVAGQREVNAVLHKYRDALLQLELERAQIKYASDTELSIAIPAFAEEGGKVEQALLAELGGILESEYRDGLAQALNGDPGAAPFNFGKTARDINIRTLTNADGSHSYTIKDSGGAAGGGAGLDISNITIAMSGASSETKTSGFGFSSLATRSTGPGGGAYVKTIQATELPAEYRHFVPAE